MNKQLTQVTEFYKAFGIPMAQEPRLLDSDRFFLRSRLLIEELNEYKYSCMQKNLTEVADALGDMLYILIGTILEHGMQHKIEEIFDEIQRSNMSKLDENGKPILRSDGKILKSSTYSKPNIKDILDEK